MLNNINTLYRNTLQHRPSKARGLKGIERQKIALNALKEDSPISHIADNYDVSRKFVYQQKTAALEALSQAFQSENTDSKEVLYHLPITKKWVSNFVLELILLGHSSFRGVCEILKDNLNIDMSIGSVHNIVQTAIEAAKYHNNRENLSTIKVGAHDEIFQSGSPVLVGCDVNSTYCYLLAAKGSRDADTWGVSLLEAYDRGLDPDYTIADQGSGLRAGQRLAWPTIPCHGDVFHALQDFGKTTIYLENRAYGRLTAKYKLDKKMLKAKKKNKGNKLSSRLASTRQACEKAIELTDNMNILFKWVQEDILSVIGPDLNVRQEMFDFVVEELKSREAQAPHRIRPLRCALENQKENLLSFVELIDKKLEKIAQEYGVDKYHVRCVYLLEGMAPNSIERLEKGSKIYKLLNYRFYGIQEAIKEVIEGVVRASSVIENLNSRLRNYFFLRKQVGEPYLELLRFFLNHHRFIRSENPERIGKSPREVMTGQAHPHWLKILDLPSYQQAA